MLYFDARLPSYGFRGCYHPEYGSRRSRRWVDAGGVLAFSALLPDGDYNLTITGVVFARSTARSRFWCHFDGVKVQPQEGSPGEWGVRISVDVPKAIEISFGIEKDDVDVANHVSFTFEAIELKSLASGEGC